MTNDDSKLAEAKDKKVREQLEMPVQQVNADKLAFEKVINSLRGATHTDIFVNWQVLAKEGINRDTPISIRLREIPFRKALTTILAEVGGVTSNLGYAIDNGIIIISTRDDLNSRERQVAQVYDIYDLFAANRAPPFSVPFDATKTSGTDKSLQRQQSSGKRVQKHWSAPLNPQLRPIPGTTTAATSAASK